MPSFSRQVEVDWQGGLMDGTGQARAGTGAFTLPVSFPKRIEEKGQGMTSPEELMAAAHAACYAMALNGALGRKNAKAARTIVTATVTADKGEAGIKIVSSKLHVIAEGLEGLDAAQFAETAREADGRCPVSNAYRGSLQISVEAETR
jgi:osmotically inducible protein OsmC